VGVDVVHPIEPLPTLDPGEVKARFGDKLSFLGAIDIVQAMPGNQEDVVEEVKTRLRQLATGGGYILAPANHLQTDVQPQNVVTLYQAARQYGKYPILF
jgi:uroporphyrinogen decarboxylase